MLALALALAWWPGGPADAAVIGPWLEAATCDSATAKSVALGQGLRAIGRGQYSPKRADAIGLLYGSLLVANVPAPTKWQVCRTLSVMDGLDTSIDTLLKLAGKYKATAAAKKEADRAALQATGGFLEFRTGLWPDEERLADDLIAALWTRKSGGRSHFSAALSRFPPSWGKVRELSR